MRTIDDLGDLSGRTVLVRSDLNVPLGRHDDHRRRTDPCVRAHDRAVALGGCACRGLRAPRAAEGRGRPVVLARVGGRADGRALRHSGRVRDGHRGGGGRGTVAGLADGEVALLENLRFDPRETSKDDGERGAFADELATLADAYVSDGFGVVHRKQASVYDLPQRLPHAAGGLVLAEVEVLGRLTHDPERPYVVVLGGSKVSDKLGVIDRLLATADRILVGGGMVFTFLAAQGREVGNSLLEADQLDRVRGYLDEAERRGVEIVLPVDVVAATAFAADAPHDVVPADAIPPDRMGLDIGPRSGELFARSLADARTVFWNGPMGVFEMPPYSHGTRAVAQALADSDAFTVVGGGDSAAAVRTLGFAESAFGHISTGGGASLEYLEGKTLPGLTVLE